MKIREWIALQKEMVQEISGILSIALLTVNVGLTIFVLVKEAGGILSNPYIVVPSVVLLIGLTVWGIAWVYHFKGKMHRAKHRAMATLNPYNTTDFIPFEWVLWKNVNLPQLRAQRELLEQMGSDTSELDETIERVESWLEQGRIPKQEFPEMMDRLLRAV